MSSALEIIQSFGSNDQWAYHIGYLAKYTELTPEEIVEELKLMQENSRRRKGNDDLDGYVSGEERESITRTLPKRFKPYEGEASKVPIDQLYKDMKDTLPVTKTPIRLGEGKRRAFVNKFGWASLTESVVDEIVKFVGNQRVLEIGSGKGLLAHLLGHKGVKVVATDNMAELSTIPEERFYIRPENLTAKEAVAKYGSDPTSELFCPVLLISWGREEANVQREFKGDKYVFIGEKHGDGATFGYPLKDIWIEETNLQIAKNLQLIDCVDEVLILCKRKTL